MGIGVVKYCTPEGGSGYIANPALPWLSSYVVTQQAPVYDQTTAWLRDSEPGTYTNYSRFGPPYSVDGGVLPPYEGGAQPLPAPVNVGCGMSGLGACNGDRLASVLLRSDVVAPMPNINDTARANCGQPVSNCPSGVAGWIENNPWLAVGAALVLGAFLLGKGGR